MEQYVTQIMTAAHQLTGIGLKMDEEWTSTILLAGFPNQYQPMIMAIESSGMRITGDAIKIKLLQEEKANVLKPKNTETDSAYYCKQQRPSQKQQAKVKGPKCFSCNSYGHIGCIPIWSYSAQYPVAAMLYWTEESFPFQ